MNTRKSQLEVVLPPGHCPARIDSVEAWKQVQLVMSAALFRPLTRDDGMQRRREDGRPMHEVVEEFILPNDRMSAFERLEVYNRQYWYRLLDCLHEDYPGLRVLLGEARFHRMCRDYLAACPSESWTLRNLGSRLVAFLGSYGRWNATLRAKAVAVARTEWAQTLAFDEASRTPVRGDDLLGVDAAELRLGLQPYLSLLELDHAVDRFMHLVRKQDAGLRGAASHAVPERAGRAEELKSRTRRPALRREKVWLAVHRFDNAIYFKRLDRESYLLLGALRAGQTVADAVGTALEEADPSQDWAGKIRDAFANWAALGWLCDFETTDNAPGA